MNLSWDNPAWTLLSAVLDNFIKNIDIDDVLDYECLLTESPHFQRSSMNAV